MTWAAIVVNARRLPLKRPSVISLHNWKLQTRFIRSVNFKKEKTIIDSKWMEKQKKRGRTLELWVVARLAILHGLSTSKSLVGVKILDTSKL